MRLSISLHCIRTTRLNCGREYYRCGSLLEARNLLIWHSSFKNYFQSLVLKSSISAGYSTLVSRLLLILAATAEWMLETISALSGPWAFMVPLPTVSSSIGFYDTFANGFVLTLSFSPSWRKAFCFCNAKENGRAIIYRLIEESKISKVHKVPHVQWEAILGHPPIDIHTPSHMLTCCVHRKHHPLLL